MNRLSKALIVAGAAALLATKAQAQTAPFCDTPHDPEYAITFEGDGSVGAGGVGHICIAPDGTAQGTADMHFPYGKFGHRSLTGTLAPIDGQSNAQLLTLQITGIKVPTGKNVITIHLEPTADGNYAGRALTPNADAVQVHMYFQAETCVPDSSYVPPSSGD